MAFLFCLLVPLFHFQTSHFLLYIRHNASAMFLAFWKMDIFFFQNLVQTFRQTYFLSKSSYYLFNIHKQVNVIQKSSIQTFNFCVLLSHKEGNTKAMHIYKTLTNAHQCYINYPLCKRKGTRVVLTFLLCMLKKLRLRRTEWQQRFMFIFLPIYE